jgi:flagellin-like hook-associated protein FlgL
LQIMTADIRTRAGAGAPVDGDSAVIALKGMLVGLRADARVLSDRIDQAMTRSQTISGDVTAASEFSIATEQTTAAKDSLDEATSAVTSMETTFGAVSSHLASAEEQLTEAIDALRRTEQAADDIRRAGAGGKATAPATDGA